MAGGGVNVFGDRFHLSVGQPRLGGHDPGEAGEVANVEMPDCEVAARSADFVTDEGVAAGA
jgi:hypothetical protein